MSEWQPARIVIKDDELHRCDPIERLPQDEIDSLLKKIVIIRPANLRFVKMSHFPCFENGVRIFEVHPNDRINDDAAYVCEHEILTD